jgi:hypothetical protein
MYHEGPSVKKSGPNWPNKAKGRVLDAILEESEKDPSAPSHVISERVRRIRNERGKADR